MTDTEFAAFMRNLPRELSAEQVETLEHEHDLLRGPYVPHGGEVHHYSDESRH